MSEANNIISLPSESKIRYNILYLASKIVCKKDEKILVLFEFDIELLYGRYANRCLLGGRYVGYAPFYCIKLITEQGSL